MMKNGQVLHPKTSQLPETKDLWKDHVPPPFAIGKETTSLAFKSTSKATSNSSQGSIGRWVEGIEPPTDPFLPELTPNTSTGVSFTHAKENVPIEGTKRVRTLKGKPASKLATTDNITAIRLTNSGNENKASNQPGDHIRLDPPPIKAPFLPPHPAKSQISVDRVNAVWESSVVVGSPKSANLIDLSEPVQDQMPSNTQNSKLKHTMNQRAPSRSNDVAITSLKAYEDATLKLLNFALPRTGPIDFKIDFGRILLNHKTGSAVFKNHTFSEKEWTSAFPEKGGIQTVFTQRQGTIVDK